MKAILSFISLHFWFLFPDEQELTDGLDSFAVKESGIVDLSRDPTRYNGLKGEIVSLSGLTIPTGIYGTFLLKQTVSTNVQLGRVF